MNFEAMQPGGKPEKKIYKAAVIDAGELLDAQARDVGDAYMTESKKQRDENWFLRTGKRIWKHNVFQEYYRQKAIIKAKKEILESGNLYAGEKEFDPDGPASKQVHDGAMSAIVERFTSEYEDDMLRDEEKDSREFVTGQEINRQLKDLIKRYAGSSMSREAFEEEKNRILSSYDKELASKKSLHADNLFGIAKEIRESVEHGQKLSDLDFEVELILGEAKGSIGTEAHHSDFDKNVEWIQNSKIGKFIANSPAALLLSAGLYEGLKKVTQKTASTAAHILPFVGGAVVSGSIAAMKESARLNRERAQHMRERAKGMEFKEPDMKRREQMEQNAYEMRSATAIIESLHDDLARVEAGEEMSEEELNEIMARLADLESRIKLNDQRSIDLIFYDKFNTVEKDRTEMDLSRATLKVRIRNRVADGTLKMPAKTDFDTYLNEMTDTQKEQLLGGDRGIDRKDEIFRKMKKGRVWRAGLTAGGLGAVAGFVFQEIESLSNSTEDGLIEGIFKSLRHHAGGQENELTEKGTALEYLRRTLMGEHPRMPHDSFIEGHIGNATLDLPKGAGITQNPDGTFDILRNGEVIAHHVPMDLDAQGNLSPATLAALHKNNIYSNFSVIGEKTTATIHESAEDYMKAHASGTHLVHRELWYDNNTPHPFDKNELKLWWGGDNNTGIDAHGNYVFNASHMLKDGSFHGTSSIDAASAVKGGHLKMMFSLSEDTQHRVFEVPIGPDGNAIIDPKSELGKLMFETHDGHAIFTGKFAEVAQTMGTAHDGGENVRILATHVGPGKDMVNDIVTKDTRVSKIILDLPGKNTGEFPPFIPVIGPRRPLEKGEYKKNKDVTTSRRILDHEREFDSIVYQEIPADKIKGKNADGVIYSKDKGFTGPEIGLPEKTDYIAAVFGLDKAFLQRGIQETNTSVTGAKNREVVIFEDNQSHRRKNLKKVEELKTKNPTIKFRYIELPKNMKSVDPRTATLYMTKRLESIRSTSKIKAEVKQRLYTAAIPVVEKKKIPIQEKPLPTISVKEWARFQDTDEVSDARLRDIARKLKAKKRLSQKERAMYDEYDDDIDERVERMK